MRHAPKHIRIAVKFCEGFIAAAKIVDWTNKDESYNFTDAGIHVLIEDLKKLDDEYLKEARDENSV